MFFCVTEYTGNYIYKNGNLEFFNHSEGYVEKETDGYKYVYQYKDHLGNIRLSYKDANKDGNITQEEIIQEKNYYPFGLQHKGYNDTYRGRNHQYGFNGIEEEKALGLDLYEMPLRQYDPAIARWTRIDPIDHLSQTTYGAFDGNPVFWADPSGAAVEQTEDGRTYTGEHAKVEFLNLRNQYSGGTDPKKKKKNNRVGERERREESNYQYTDQEITDIENRYRDIVSYGREKEFDTAANLLEHFLDGKGGIYNLSPEWLLKFSEVKKAQRTNLLRFASQSLSIFLNLEEGESRTFTDHWDRSLTGSIFGELYYASGTSTLTSKGTFTVSNRAGKIYISGSISHKWNDPYDWHGGLGVILPRFGLVSDEDAQILKYTGKAKDFNMRSSWNQNVEWNGLWSIPQH